MYGYYSYVNTLRVQLLILIKLTSTSFNNVFATLKKKNDMIQYYELRC